ncbi:MAG: AraC family transcriptional regulator [Ruminococcaceae bacterium]|nr:AraC family transcriptional regulator [Oscillospiraceae bacterium]
MDARLLASLSKITAEEQLLLGGNMVEKSMYASGRDFTVDSAKMLKSGALIAIRPHTRFAPFPRHTHNYIEIMYMCSGKTTHIINGGAPLTLQAGEMLFLNKHACHAISRAEVQDVAVNFIILPQFFDTALEMLGGDNMLSRFLQSSLQTAQSEVSYLHFKVADVLPVQNLVENMVWSIVNKHPNTHKINKPTMALLMLTLLNFTSCIDTPQKADNTNALVMAALREIDENYHDASLSRVAEKHNVSAAYVSRLVKESMGAGFTQLLQQKRLSKAAVLLKTSTIPVRDIIAAVGYDNTSYFHRVFKEAFGASPKEYRKRG